MPVSVACPARIMYANSRVPVSSQIGRHARLPALLARHAQTPFLKPVLDYNRKAFDAFMSVWAERYSVCPLILDAGCGTGVSTFNLARQYPECFVVGVDQSTVRLSTQKTATPENACLVRADLVDFWRLLLEQQITLHRHYLLYPNPWPKIGQLSRRWHGHAIFPTLLRLGGMLECRSNWSVYIEEFASALTYFLKQEVSWHPFLPSEPLTPFERKYHDSGQMLYRCVVSLGGDVFGQDASAHGNPDGESLFQIAALHSP